MNCAREERVFVYVSSSRNRNDGRYSGTRGDTDFSERFRRIFCPRSEMPWSKHVSIIVIGGL